MVSLMHSRTTGQPEPPADGLETRRLSSAVPGAGTGILLDATVSEVAHTVNVP